MAPVPAPVDPILPPELCDTAARINAEITAAEDACRASVAHAIAAGRLLVEAKKKLGHGRFGGWVAANIDAADRTVRLFMQIAKGWETLSAEKRQHVADLPLREALRAIEGPKAKTPWEESFTPAQQVLWDRMTPAAKRFLTLVGPLWEQLTPSQQVSVRSLMVDEDSPVREADHERNHA